MADVTLSNVQKSYGSTNVVHGIDLQIQSGKFVVFVGPSGCGKSTLLRMIAGLEDISDGTIAIDGKTVNDVAPSKRGVAMVFQTYALYPHMSVYKNMAFGLRQAKIPEQEIDRRVREAATILDIGEYLERLPRALSGGQRQRVAIGRAIVREPQVFLFDEPLSNLDAALRHQTRLEIARLHKRLATTMIYVTHDQIEAMTLADTIVVLNQGRIEQVGAPVDVYRHPDNVFVAQFIGSPRMNFFTPTDFVTVPKNLPQGIEESDVLIGIRPEHMRLNSVNNALISAQMELIEHLGENVLVHMKTSAGSACVAKLDIEPDAELGTTLHFTANSTNLHFFRKSTGARL